MTSVAAGRVLTADGWRDEAAVEFSDGIITDIRPGTGGGDRVLAPGFVDLQVNGIDEVDVATAVGTDWSRLDALLLAQGVTTWCPTLVTAPLSRYADPLRRIAEAMTRPTPGRPTIAGVHLEGPFLGGAAGAHRPELIVPIDLEWIRTLPSHIAVMTLAAEQPLATEATRVLTGAGVLVAIGHSTASADEFDAVVAAGARLVTHLFNGMSGLHHRSPGVAAFALTNEAVSASLIADGVHVHPRMVHMGFNALGAARAVLVTDAVGWRRGTVGPVRLEFRDGAPRLPDGTLAGSALTMDAAIRVCVASGVELATAVRAASTNPARLLGLHDRGVIAIGQRADLVALTPDLQVEQVWVAGSPAH